ncbi:DUF4173 domain-containing protein [Actinoplanes sp. NPDC049668]|uniref:DUF4153 domain-containing protein n=1 Tax=unclassified Actinoplanes TaxID=2626549 RepID=UPI0033AF910A
MTEPPPEQRTPTDPARPAAPGPNGDAAAAPAPAPQLLVMPQNDAIPSMPWPGPDGAPAWAIPVQVPSGTRGYALFIPMLPVQAPAADGAAAQAPAPQAAAEAGTVVTVSHPEPAKVDAAPIEPSESDHAVVSEPPPAPSEPPPARSAPPVPPPAQIARALHTPPPLPQPVPLVAYQRYQPPPSRWQKFREKHWPGPAKAAGWAVPAAVLAAALGFVLFVPLNRTGIGWFLGWLVLTAGVVAAVRRTANLPRTEVWIRSGWAAAALALLLVLTFRNAWWLVTFSVLGALGCTALAIVGGQRVRSILFSLVAAPYAALKGIPWVRRHLRASRRNPGIARRVAFSVGLTVVVLFVFGALLSSADVAFSTLLDKAVPPFDIGSIFKWIFLAVVGGLIAVAGTYTLSAPPATGSLDTDGRSRFGLVEWAPACAALVLLFAGFVAVQFTVLFGGATHVLETSGLSYAQYARSGFWQLVAVTLLSLALLAALARWARRDEPRERMLLRVLLGLLCGLSVVIVVSALTRMWAYQRVYSFTGERIFVMSFELLLGVVFIMIAAAGIKWQGRWIPGATVGLAVLMLLGLAVLDPEGYAASRNAVRYEHTGKIDAWYLRALSADATPALTRLPDPVRRCTLSWIADDLREPDPWYAWNLGRARARAALERLGPGAVGTHADCRAADQYDLPKKR